MKHGSLNHRIEKWLYKRGFANADVRQVMRLQIVVCLGFCLAGMGALTVTLLGQRWFGLGLVAGTLLATWNFYHLAKGVPGLLRGGFERGKAVTLLVSFYGRLFLTGAVLFSLIFWAQVSYIALLTGLSSVVATIALWGMARSAPQPGPPGSEGGRRE